MKKFIVLLILSIGIHTHIYVAQPIESKKSRPTLSLFAVMSEPEFLKEVQKGKMFLEGVELKMDLDILQYGLDYGYSLETIQIIEFLLIQNKTKSTPELLQDLQDLDQELKKLKKIYSSK